MATISSGKLLESESADLGLVYHNPLRRCGRVVECTGLENRRGFTPSVSSNLTASASLQRYGAF